MPTKEELYNRIKELEAICDDLSNTIKEQNKVIEEASWLVHNFTTIVKQLEV